MEWIGYLYYVAIFGFAGFFVYVFIFIIFPKQRAEEETQKRVAAQYAAFHERAEQSSEPELKRLAVLLRDAEKPGGTFYRAAQAAETGDVEGLRAVLPDFEFVIATVRAFDVDIPLFAWEHNLAFVQGRISELTGGPPAPSEKKRRFDL